MIRILLHGNKSGLSEVRSSIFDLRSQGHTIEVRTTWEHGDIHRFVREAIQEQVPRIVAGGGDGTVNEVADALSLIDRTNRPEFAVLPLGTANDFATACEIPTDIRAALKLALEGQAVPIDLCKANERHFLNVATGGFGAQVTTETPVQLKNFLGGGAYTLTGIVKALNFSPVSGTLATADSEGEYEMIVGAACNGRQAGGGQILAPEACINDGLMDIVLVTTFPAYDIDIVISELLNPSLEGKYIKRFQTRWVEATSRGGTDQINLDGEPYFASKIRFEVIPNALNLVLPDNCPCIRREV